MPKARPNKEAILMTRRTTLFLVCAFEIALLLFGVTNEPLAQKSDWDIKLECFHSEDETKLKLQFDTDNQLEQSLASTLQNHLITN